MLTANGVSLDDVANVIGISANTCRKYYLDQLAIGRIKANAAVAEALFQHAIGSGPQAVAAAIFWLRARAGWCEYDARPR